MCSSYLCIYTPIYAYWSKIMVLFSYCILPILGGDWFVFSFFNSDSYFCICAKFQFHFVQSEIVSTFKNKEHKQNPIQMLPPPRRCAIVLLQIICSMTTICACKSLRAQINTYLRKSGARFFRKTSPTNQDNIVTMWKAEEEI